MALGLLAATMLVGLVLIPLGLPGTWVMVGAALAYDALAGTGTAGTGTVGTATIVGTALLATVGEVLEFTLAGRFARRYGGSRRAGWGAILGGIVGAIVGVPVPIIGSVIGAFAGAFAGALLLEYTRGSGAQASTRVATGALLGRAAAVAVKSAIGCAIAAWILLAAWR